MRQNPHVRICGGLGSATALVYPTFTRGKEAVEINVQLLRGGGLPHPRTIANKKRIHKLQERCSKARVDWGDKSAENDACEPTTVAATSSYCEPACPETGRHVLTARTLLLSHIVIGVLVL